MKLPAGIRSCRSPCSGGLLIAEGVAGIAERWSELSVAGEAEAALLDLPRAAFELGDVEAPVVADSDNPILDSGMSSIGLSDARWRRSPSGNNRR